MHQYTLSLSSAICFMVPCSSAEYSTCFAACLEGVEVCGSPSKSSSSLSSLKSSEDFFFLVIFLIGG